MLPVFTSESQILKHFEFKESSKYLEHSKLDSTSQVNICSDRTPKVKESSLCMWKYKWPNYGSHDLNQRPSVFCADQYLIECFSSRIASHVFQLEEKKNGIQK